LHKQELTDGWHQAKNMELPAKIKKYNVSHLVGKEVFSKLSDLEFYINNWIDIDPYTIYEKGIDVDDPLLYIA